MIAGPGELERLSPTLAAAFLGCSAAAAWTLEVRRGLRAAAEPVENPHSALIARKGLEHEAICLAELRERCGDVVEIPSGALDTRFAATVEAMERGAPLIYQAALTAGSWLGYADFLVRVDESCPRWAWSYEPWDAKLSRNAKPEHLLQIALYGDFLATVQDRSAHHGALMLGTGDHASELDLARIALSRFGSVAAAAGSGPEEARPDHGSPRSSGEEHDVLLTIDIGGLQQAKD